MLSRITLKRPVGPDGQPGQLFVTVTEVTFAYYGGGEEYSLGLAGEIYLTSGGIMEFQEALALNGQTLSQDNWTTMDQDGLHDYMRSLASVTAFYTRSRLEDGLK